MGSGTRFLSGISYYTIHLANALSEFHPVSVILMRQLLPTCFYPGRSRVGIPLTHQGYVPEIKVFDGVDWYWIPSILRAVAFLNREKPDVVIFQWWTGTTLHSYLLVALFARLIGAKIVIEFHEVLDTGEARLGLVNAYVNFFLPWLIRLSSGFVFHSEFDRIALEKQYRLGNYPKVIIPHGPYDQYNLDDDQPCHREATEGCCNLLFFGVIRPFKGLEDLITAFDSMPQNEINKYWLTIVGETWEGWTLPVELINQSRYRRRITFVNRYVPDEEVAAFFSGADAVVLPYHRSSASGPLHVAMSQGLPVVVSRVGGLPEAVKGYEGAILIPPKNPEALKEALISVFQMKGKHFSTPYSWKYIIRRFENIFDSTPLNSEG